MSDARPGGPGGLPVGDPPGRASPSGDGRLRVALFGSPAFALPTLEALHARRELVLVVSQPDRPAGRGLRSSPPATARRARELGLPLEQPPRLKGNAAFARRLEALELDVAVTAAYGKILPATLLAVPHDGFLNVHASLLPRYRGAAPVQWALIRGERETGVSIMRTDPGLDTGPVCLQRAIAIPDEAAAPELMAALAELGARALSEALDRLAAGTLTCRPQDEAEATHAPMLTREDGRIRWRDPADAVSARHRGVKGWPGSHFTVGEDSGSRPVKVPELRPAGGPGPVFGAARAAGAGATPEPGTVLAVDAEGMTVACGRGAVVLVRVQPPGKRAMPARDWANGRGVRPGVRLG